MTARTAIACERPRARIHRAQVEKGVRGIGKSIADIQQGLRQAERKVEKDARA